MNVLKIIAAIFCVIFVVLYYTGIYFSIFDEDSLKEKKEKYEK